MPTAEERLKILKMVQDGKLTPEEASQLLEALEVQTSENVDAKPASKDDSAVAGAGTVEPKWVRVKVMDLDNQRPRLDLRLPVSLVTAGIKFGKHFSPEMEGIAPDEIFNLLKEGEPGQIADIQDEKDGERVEVYLE
jgi:hypothetical protein